MISLISPAKSLDMNPTLHDDYSFPMFQKECFQLVEVLQKKSVRSLKKLMNISNALADINTERFSNFTEEINQQNSKQAIFSFKGDVYRGIDADQFNKADLQFAQEHVRILSGLYGLLKPLDLIQPYRLEMGTKLRVKRAKNLYQFWNDKISKELNEEILRQKNPVIINLASKEYFNVVKEKLLEVPVIHIHFKEYKNGQLKFLSFNAKKARGYIIKFIVSNRIDKAEDIKLFDLENYQFDPVISEENSFTFTR